MTVITTRRGVVGGIRRPVGSPYRQRTLRVSTPDDQWNSSQIWVMSVVDTRRGPMVELRRHHSPTATIAVGLEQGGAYAPEEKAAKAALLEPEHFTTKVVLQCEVQGCDRPTPLLVSNWGHRCLEHDISWILECSECGAPDEAFAMTDGEKRLASGLCWGCEFWTDRLANFDPERQVITPDWEFYTIGDSAGPSRWKGFAGAKWTITFNDGRVVQTDDLWGGGRVEEWFRDRTEPNAIVKSGWT